MMERRLPRPEFDPSVIVNHAAGLRALALSLLRDREAAEEVVQETWARALVSPAPKGEELGGWLRTVTRGLAKNRLRDDRRRLERETVAVRERRAHAAEEDDRRAETLRAVVDAVLALDEPYRRVVLARYFDGYEPTEIAARLGVPVATVATRLKRAKALLRGRLEPKFERVEGGLRGALALLAGLDPRTVTGGAATGFVLPHAKELAAAALVLLLGLGWWIARPAAPGSEVEGASGAELAAVERESSELARPTSRAGTSAPDGGRDVDGHSAGAERAALVRNAPAVERAARVASPGRAARRERGPFLFHLVVEALDRDLHPMGGVLVLGAPAGGTLNDLGATDWNGRLEREWRGFEPVCELELEARHAEEGASPLLRVRVVHDATTEARLPLRLAAVDDAAATEKRPASERRRTQRRRREASSGSKPPADAGIAPVFELDDLGNGVFGEPLLLAEAASGPSRATARPVTSAPPSRPTARTFRLAEEFDRDAGSSSRRGARSPASLDLACVDAAGEPVADVAVSLAFAATMERLVARTDAKGRVRLPLADTGRVQLVMGSGAWSHASEELDLRGVDLTLTRTLRRAEPMALFLTGSTGQPRNGWTVEAWNAREAAQFAGHARTDAGGRATLFLPSGGPWRLLARRAGAKSEIAELVHEAAWPSAHEATFALADPALSTGSVSATFTGTGGRRLAKPEARLWDPRSGQGLVLGGAPVGTGRENEVERAFESPNLRSGVYVLEAGGEGQRWSSFGEVRVPAGKTLDLGRVAFRDSASVELDSTVLPFGAKATVEFTAKRGGALMRCDAFDVELPVRFDAAPGAYEVTVHYAVAKPAASGAPAADAKDAELRTDTYALDLRPGNPGRIDVGAEQVPMATDPSRPNDPRRPTGGASKDRR
ncbi:MAG: sigma-70 family RNA polymerase sigma factor [Planctomycetes bacterium]|nr:sigma-70 family RNA polymerase sigma factor [Planctomycetota bacterium]